MPLISHSKHLRFIPLIVSLPFLAACNRSKVEPTPLRQIESNFRISVPAAPLKNVDSNKAKPPQKLHKRISPKKGQNKKTPKTLPEKENRPPTNFWQLTRTNLA